MRIVGGICDSQDLCIDQEDDKIRPMETDYGMNMISVGKQSARPARQVRIKHLMPSIRTPARQYPTATSFSRPSKPPVVRNTNKNEILVVATFTTPRLLCLARYTESRTRPHQIVPVRSARNPNLSYAHACRAREHQSHEQVGQSLTA